MIRLFVIWRGPDDEPVLQSFEIDSYIDLVHFLKTERRNIGFIWSIEEI